MKIHQLPLSLLPVIAVLLLALPGFAAPRKEGLRLDGGFIQYQEWMMKMSGPAWGRELDAMHAIGMDLVVLQWVRYNHLSFMSADSKGVDATEEILKGADARGMKVYVGLATDDDWWNKSGDAAYLDRAAAESEQLATEVWNRYGHHASFAGWYIPQEPWDGDFSDAYVATMKRFFRRISDRCKSLAGPKPVAMAPFFAGTTAADRVERSYARLLEGAGIDILMPQDGVGARRWDSDVAGHVVPYYRAFRNACTAAGVELWSDLESFRLAGAKGASFVPADAARIARQVVAESPFVRRFVTFDFFHYMSPHRGPAQRALYDGYRQAFVERAFLPTFGRSTQVDPGFSYYRDRSPESIAAEIRAAGYPIVRYVLTADSAVRRPLIDALHRERIGVWYLTFANGTYSTTDLPKGWQAWRMVTRSDLEGKPLNDGYHRLCLNNPDYRAWKKRQVTHMLRAHPFEGVELVEPHWPEYPGITSPAYACFCTHCAAAFRRMYPDEHELPDILHAESPRAPGRNPGLWAKWLRFREASLTDFLNDLVNGPGGIRASAPRAKVCVWTLALSEPDGVRRVREDSGEDAAHVAATVRPDMFCLQTHWPDWVRADLPADYPRQYEPFIDPIRAAVPGLPLMVQADTGSQKQNRRSRAWIERFERTCAAVGAESTTYYEYFISGEIYTDPPRIAEAQRLPDGVELRFTKRLDARTAGDTGHYTLSSGRVASATVDGSIVRLKVEGGPSGDLVVTARGLADAEDRRLYHDHPACVLAEQTVRLPGMPVARGR